MLIICQSHNDPSIQEKRMIAIRAIEYLLEDHKLINEMIELLDISIEKADKEKKFPGDVMSKELEFCRDFINKWHESKEEQVLIPELHKSGYPLDRGPIFETLEDHRKGRSILRRWISSDKTANDEQKIHDFIEFAGAYSLYLYEHLREEEKGLFHSASLAIKESRVDDMIDEYSKLDKEFANIGGRAKYEQIVERLKKEIA